MTTPDPVKEMLKYLRDKDQEAKDIREQMARERNEMKEQMEKLIDQVATASASASARGPGSTQGGSIPHVQVRAIAGVKAPNLSADSNLANFNSWKCDWEDYAETQQLSKHTVESQVAALKNCLDEEIKRYMRQDVIEVPAGATVAQVIEAIKTWIKKKRNCLLDRRDFYTRKQDRSEPFDNFFADIKELQDSSDFKRDEKCTHCTANSTEALRDRIITGIYSDETREKLLAEKSLSLDKTVEMCRAIEGAAATNKGMTTGTSGINQFKRKSAYKQQQQQQQQKGSGSQPKGGGNADCRRCGNKPHQGTQTCPAQKVTCNHCNIKGHFAKVCMKKNSAQPSNKGKKKTGRLRLRATNKVPDCTVKLATQLKNSKVTKDLRWLADTGAEVCAIGIDDLRVLGGNVKMLQPDDEEVEAVGGHILQSLGKIQANIRCGKQTVTEDIHVYKKLDDALLSRSALIAFGWIAPDWPRNKLQALSRTDIEKQSQVTRESLLEEFTKVFNDEELPPMNAKPMTIKLKPNAVPFRVNGARSIPYAYRDQIKAQLDKWEQQEVCEKVEGPSEWCHAIVIVNKKDSDEKRLTVDLTKLNKQVETTQHPSRTPKDAIESIKKGSKYFTLLDARNGYFQVLLDPDSRHLTTFATPWGRYRFLRVPQGYVCSGDEYNQRTDAAFDGVPNMVKIVDDILIFNETYEEHINSVRTVLERASQYGITLSAKKFVFAEPKVNYCGHNVGEEGWEIEEAKVKALRKFPMPSNRTDLRSLVGLAGQFGTHAKVAQLTDVLRPLMKEKMAFHWESEHTQAVEGLRENLSSTPILAYYDPKLPTKLETDASRTKGLGFALWQKDGETWKLIQVGSRYLSDCETRYAMIELELLAVVWAYKKCRLFLEGKDFELVIDHKPLVPILNNYSLDCIENSRIVRLMLKIQDAKYTARWVKGEDHKVADALSRAPVDDPTSADELGEVPGKPSGIRALRTRDPATTFTRDAGLEKLKNEAEQDTVYQALKRQVLAGFPEKKQDLATELHPYWGVRNNLTTDDDLVLRDQQLVIPRSMQRHVLDELHASHQGQQKTKRRARQVVYWPNMSQDIDNVVSSCQACAERLASLPKEPLMSDTDPQFPFEDASTDLFHHNGKEYLVYADKLSGWPFVTKIGKSATATDVIRAIRGWFTQVGAPRRITSDNGPQFSSHRFKEFCRRWDIVHDPSTPHNPQANGHAEAMVKAVKRLIQKIDPSDTEAFDKGLLELRNGPKADGRSPAQVLFGRPLKSCVPSHWTAYSPEWQKAQDLADAVKEDIAQKQKIHYDATAKPLQEFKVGIHVSIQNPTSKLWDTHGRIVGVGKRRDYHIKLGSGRILWRNRKFLRPYKPAVPGFGSSSGGGSKPQPPADNQDEDPQGPRKSTRSRKKPKRFQAKKTGKSHD